MAVFIICEISAVQPLYVPATGYVLSQTDRRCKNIACSGNDNFISFLSLYRFSYQLSAYLSCIIVRSMTIVTELAAMAAGLQSDNRSDTANSKERIFFFITNYGTSQAKPSRLCPEKYPWPPSTSAARRFVSLPHGVGGAPPTPVSRAPRTGGYSHCRRQRSRCQWPCRPGRRCRPLCPKPCCQSCHRHSCSSSRHPSGRWC